MNNVDFKYAFAPSHRITLSRPSASRKVLADVSPDGLVFKWTNDDCRSTYPFTWRIMPMDVETYMSVSVDGKLTRLSSWYRHASGAPYLFAESRSRGVEYVISAISTKSGVVIKTTLKNTSKKEHEVHLQFALTNIWNVSNKGWIDGKNNDVLLAMNMGRADKVIALATGADEYIMYRFVEGGGVDRPPMSNEKFNLAPHSKKKLTPYFHLDAGEEKSCYIYLPEEAYFAELDALKSIDFEAESAAALAEWERFLARGAKFEIPDEAMAHAVKSSIADIFVMREKTGKDGRYCINCGTDVYRSSNSMEPAVAECLIDSLGYTREAASDMSLMVEAQDSNGCFVSERCWEHEMWGSIYWKTALMYHHYKLTRDREQLESFYKRMYASSMFNRDARRSTLSAEREWERGLMPRGMGDCGLQNGGDFYGVFYPHNFLAVGADMITLECAKILGKSEDIPILEELVAEARRALLKSVRENAIEEDGYSRIPAIAGVRENSLWGSLYGFYPSGVMAADDPLVEGGMRFVETRAKSEGGLPKGTGWLKDGLWVAMALDNFSSAYLRMGKFREARQYLYPAVNHASPLVTWCEERGAEAGSKLKTGDAQHLWTPLSVGVYMVDAFFTEHGGKYMLFPGIIPEWLDAGRVGVRGLCTSLGKTDLSIKKVKEGYRVSFRCQRDPKAKLLVHIPTEDGARVVEIDGATRIDTVIK